MQALSQFTGQACRKYERMDLAAICQYLANTLKAAQPFDLLVLKALVNDMSVRHPAPFMLARRRTPCHEQRPACKGTWEVADAPRAIFMPEILAAASRRGDPTSHWPGCCGVGARPRAPHRLFAHIQGDVQVCLCMHAWPQGIDLVSDLSAEQVEALAGGPVLQAEVIPLAQGTPQASAKALQRTVQRLAQALQHVRAHALP